MSKRTHHDMAAADDGDGDVDARQPRIRLESLFAQIDLEQPAARRRLCDLFLQWSIARFEAYAPDDTPLTSDSARIELFLLHLPDPAKQWCLDLLDQLHAARTRPRFLLYGLMDAFVNSYRPRQRAPSIPTPTPSISPTSQLPSSASASAPHAPPYCRVCNDAVALNAIGAAYANALHPQHASAAALPREPSRRSRTEMPAVGRPAPVAAPSAAASNTAAFDPTALHPPRSPRSPRSPMPPLPTTPTRIVPPGAARQQESLDAPQSMPRAASEHPSPGQARRVRPATHSPPALPRQGLEGLRGGSIETDADCPPPPLLWDESDDGVELHDDYAHDEEQGDDNEDEADRDDDRANDDGISQDDSMAPGQGLAQDNDISHYQGFAHDQGFEHDDDGSDDNAGEDAGGGAAPSTPSRSGAGRSKSPRRPLTSVRNPYRQKLQAFKQARSGGKFAKRQA